MVEIKIACQCGVPFRYGLELVDGRAPEGVGCPTCNAPITPACNALLDHLTGKPPSPEPSGSRVLKDIKVTCACGARYKFELELEENTMPAPVVCPACQAELNELANQELARFPARFADILPLIKAAAPATPTVPAAPAPAPPPSELPAATIAPPPATAPEAPPAPPVAAPVSVLPVLPVPQRPATAPVTPAPAGEPPAATAPPPATAPEAPPAPPVAAPVSVLPVLPVAQRPAPAPVTPAPASEPPAAASASTPASAPETPSAQPASVPTSTADLPPSPSATQAPAPAAPLGAPAVAAAGVIPEYGPLFPSAESSKPPRKGMPNLKPLEVPRMERPARPAGSTPAAAKPPGAASGAAPASAPGQPRPDTSPAAKADPKPAPAKPAAKPVVKVEVVRDVNVPLGAAGAFVGALLGAGIWFAVLKLAPMGGAWMALLVGVLAGLGARLVGRGTSQALGAVACGMSVVFIAVMSWITIGHHINRLAQPFLKGRYEFIMAEAKEAMEAKSDVDLKRVVARSVPTADPTMILVSEADLKAFKEQRLPFLRDMAAGKISKDQFESRELAKYRSNYPLDEAWDAAIGIVGLLCALAGIIAGAKIAFKRT